MVRGRPSFWLHAAAALFGGLLLRLWFIAHHPAFAGDAIIYGSIARNLLLHGVYGFNQQISSTGATSVVPTLIRLPGYPLFLALCFRLFGLDNYTAVLFVQAAADLLTCVLASFVAADLFGRRAALAVLWIAALCPFTANYVATPLTETLVLTTIVLTFGALVRWRSGGAGYNHWLWPLAASLSASLLLRPDQALLAAAVLPAVIWMDRKQRRAKDLVLPRAVGPALAAALCMVLPLTPWTLRNWRAFHLFQPLAPRSATDPGELPPAGFNRWYRTWGVDFTSTDQVYWNVNGARIDPSTLPTRAFALSCTVPRNVAREALPLYASTVALIAEYNQTATDAPELDARFAALAEQRARAAPLCYAVGLPAARLFNMLLRPRTELLRIPDEWWGVATPARQRAFALFYAVLNFGYVVLGVCGYGAWLRLADDKVNTKPVLYAMAAAVLLRAALLTTLDNSEPRYTLEFFPVFFVCAGAIFAPRNTACTPPSAETAHALEP